MGYHSLCGRCWNVFESHAVVLSVRDVGIAVTKMTTFILRAINVPRY